MGVESLTSSAGGAPGFDPQAMGVPGSRYPAVGAHVVSGGVMFRVWAPEHEKLRVAVGAPGQDTRYIECERDAEGYFTGRDDSGRAGDDYWFQIDGRLVPDPASRHQPAGVEGSSRVVDPAGFAWKTADWRRPPLRGRVIYELHVGTFTPAGTFRAAMEKLDALVDLGVNAIELMPLGDFAGERNWGYDGVMIFAPARCYGTPDDLRALIDAAHARGLAVIVDVVYNHFGPSGNVLPALSHWYHQPDRDTGWGQGLNFDGEHCAPVRRFFLQNVCMWFDEYRVDGLRLDAVHAIDDRSTPHIVAEIAAAARARGGFTIAEDERNDARIVTPADAQGWGVDGMWADDFHHTSRVALTGQRHAHFRAYQGTLDEWVETLRHGWFYRGQDFPMWGRPRGTPTDHLSFEQFVVCISNHDQVGNRPLGDRLNHAVSPEHYRALSMLLCLVPYTPMLFMGQEWAASTPFPYFTDLPGEVGRRMKEYRWREFQRNQSGYDDEIFARMPDPKDESTFRAAKLDWSERDRTPHAGVLALYRACLRLRAQEPVFRAPERKTWTIEKIGDAAVGLRAHLPEGDWLLVSSVNRVGEIFFERETFTSLRTGRLWERVLDSNDPRFGGGMEGPRAPGSEVAGGISPLRLAAPATSLWRERS